MFKRLLKILILGIIFYSISLFIKGHFGLHNRLGFMGRSIDDTMGETGKLSTDAEFDEDELLQRIEQGLLGVEDSIKVDNRLLGDEEFLSNVIESALARNPEIMYYKGARYGRGKLFFEYSKSAEDIKLHRNIIRRRRDRIIEKLIRPDMSEDERVKRIHDYVIDETRYDRRYINNEPVPEESHTVYGVLGEGVALCGGYAKTMKYLLDAIDIESIVIVGETTYDNHAWNIIKIDGYYYHLDATWNDPVTEDGADVIIYDYFNLRDEDIEKTHTWDREAYPECNSNKHNYYHYNGLIADNYNQFYDRVEQSLLNGDRALAIKVLDYDIEVYDLPRIINGIVQGRVNSIGIGEYGYAINDDQGIVKIEFKYTR